MKKNQLKNQLKNLSFILILAVFSTLVFTGVESYAATPAPQTSTAAQTGVPQKQITTPKMPDRTKKMEDALKTNNPNRIGIKETIIKFLAAMVGVLISALAIFGALKFYKKFILKRNSASDNINYNQSLESPKDFKEAINIFLNKTDK